MQPSTSTASLSLAVGASPRFTVSSAPNGVRTAVLAGAAVFSGLVYLLRRGHADGVRKRVIRRLDKIAPKSKYHPHKHAHGHIINADCPVCLCEFASDADKPIRVLGCRHALCSDCLEAWAVHCTKAHLNPSRFGITRAGRVVSWTPGPKCPLCCARLNCVPKQDLREAIIAAINHRGTALSTIIAYQSRHSNDEAIENTSFNWAATDASASHHRQ
ncbi:unnamed protein product [Agarophyton chilense]